MANNSKRNPLSFMTLNVRHDNHEHSQKTVFATPPIKQNPFDPQEFLGEQPWSIRKWKILDTILLFMPDESVLHQIQDLEALLGNDYQWVGVGREDGDKQGEMAAIFYKTEILTIEDWKTVWLSETPEKVASIGWDARHSRTATQVLFKKTQDETKFTVFNVHMDHVGVQAREESCKLILERARMVSSEGPVFLMGDFNSTRQESAYQVLVGHENQEETDTLSNLEELNNVCASAFVNKSGVPIRTAEGSITLPTHRVLRPGRVLENMKRQHDYFKDTRYELLTRLKSKGAPGTVSGPFGYRDTLTSFNAGDEDVSRAPLCIDFILVLHDPQTQLQVNHHAVLPNQFDDGLYLTDHRPVLAKISW
ncbi:hypothetical protein CU098_006288 [Rhizopus stolonifer]|uniref:Endonuclease/exonuclease/phosphatase domain-containing protein n=1 Tax=Rhizopus stolonifer TaxID=4846 RepID=A0A367K3N4_RHIST|nr:hypothetical protein CU098_006288 [Rhizopus stolonifer]